MKKTVMKVVNKEPVKPLAANPKSAAKPDSLETVKMFKKEMDANQTRAEIIQKYEVDFEKNDKLNPEMKELLGDRKMLKARYVGSAIEAKQLMKRLEQEAARIQVKALELKGALKYVEDKIVAKHGELDIK